jgi:hypothetical protein
MVTIFSCTLEDKMYRDRLSKAGTSSSVYLALAALVLFLASPFSVHAQAPDAVDKILPADTLFYMGIDDYALFEKYAESMPMAKILKEEEVQEFLKKPSQYLAKNMDEVKNLLKSESEALAAELDRMMNLKLARFFVAVTHIKLPSMEGPGASQLPDVGLAVGFALQGGADPSGMVKNLFTGLAAEEGMELSFQQESYKGISSTRVTCPYAQEIPAYYFNLGDLFVFTLSKNTMNSMVDLVKGGQGALAKHPNYAKMNGEFKLASEGSVNAYMNFKKLFSLASDGIKMGLMVSGEQDFVGIVDPIMDKLGLFSLMSSFSRSLSRGGVAFGEGLISTLGAPKGLVALFPDEPITQDELKLVPKDVVNFSIFRFDMSGMYDLVMDIIKTVDAEVYNDIQEGMQGFCMALSQQTGEEPIDIRRDILGQLGTRAVYYQLGGGPSMGMMMPSMAFLVEIKDFDRLVNTIKTLIEGGSNLAPEMASEVTFSSVPYSGQEIHYLQFTQMPMMTPCFSKVGDYIAVGIQIDDIKKMIKRHAGGGESILDSQDFTNMYKKLPEGAALISLGYNQTATAFSTLYSSMAMMIPMMTMALGSDLDLPVDLQMLPTGECISKHLFSSLTATVKVNDGLYKMISYGPFGTEMLKYMGPLLATAGFAVRDYAAKQMGQAFTMEPGNEIPEPEVDPGELKNEKARVDLSALFTACFVYKLEYDEYPESMEKLLITTEDYPNGFYNAEKLPMDPWGKPYLYKRQTGGDFKVMIWSTGANGLDEGGKGDDIAKKK